MKKKTMEQTDKQKLMAKAVFNINTAYLMSDIADSFAMEAESALIQLQKGVNYGELKKFKSVANVARQLREMSRKLSSPVYDLTDAELACDNSDFIKECVTLIATRCRDDEVTRGSTRISSVETFNTKSERHFRIARMRCYRAS